MNKSYDVIVIGTGGVGSAALFALSNAGHRVLGIDRFPIAHDYGSSHGESRMIRKSYFEHADYVPLVQQSWSKWQELEERSGNRLLQKTGVVYFGEESGVVIQGVIQAALTHRLPLDQFDEAEVTTRFSQFVPPEGTVAVYEDDAGVLNVEDCIKTHIHQSLSAGATHRVGTVTGWESTTNGVVVHVDGERVSAAKLIITTGAWASNLLAPLGIPLKVVRKHMHWFAADAAMNSKECPAFFFEHQTGYFYGVPNFGSGVKTGEHSGGTVVTDPLKDSREEEPLDLKRVHRFVGECLPSVNSSCRMKHSTCFYTMTPDEHFVVDSHPEYPNVCFAAGLSGHGFKFAPAIGSALAEIAISGTVAENVKFLGLHRLIGSHSS